MKFIYKWIMQKKLSICSLVLQDIRKSLFKVPKLCSFVLVRRACNVTMSTEHWWSDIDRGKPKYWQKNPSQCHFFLHKSHMEWFWMEPRFYVTENQWRTGGVRGSNPPPPTFRRPSKIVPNSTRLWKLLKIGEFWTPTPPRCSEKMQ